MNVSHLNRMVLNGEPISSSEALVTPTLANWEGEPPQQSSAVVMSMARSETVAPHIDSAEEVLLVLDGFVEIQAGLERHIATPGNLVLIPAGVEHSICNMGFGAARVIGFFASANVETRVTEAALPESISG